MYESCLINVFMSYAGPKSVLLDRLGSLRRVCFCSYVQDPAEKLKIGDLVMVDGQPTPLTEVRYIAETVDVMKIAFCPDLPVNVFHKPNGCIASKGHKKHHHVAGHRGGKTRRGRRGRGPEDLQTEGYLTE